MTDKHQKKNFDEKISKIYLLLRKMEFGSTLVRSMREVKVCLLGVSPDKFFVLKFGSGLLAFQKLFFYVLRFVKQCLIFKRKLTLLEIFVKPAKTLLQSKNRKHFQGAQLLLQLSLFITQIYEAGYFRLVPLSSDDLCLCLPIFASDSGC